MRGSACAGCAYRARGLAEQALALLEATGPRLEALLLGPAAGTSATDR